MNLYDRIVQNISQLIAFTFITELVISWRLWIPFNREFPMISAFSYFDFSIGIVGDVILLLILLLALIFIAIDKSKIVAIKISLSCLLILVLEDITRLQAWVYIQGAILVIINFNKKGKEKAIVSGIILVISLIYIWSGIQKFNLGFIKNTFPWMISVFGIDFKIPDEQKPEMFNYFFSIIPILEFSIGLLLIISITRKLGVILGILMHLFILISLGPIGHNWNMVVWPWNVSLILFLVLIYSQKISVNVFKETKFFTPNYFVLLLFGLMPILNFVDYWDETLSGSLYSGTNSNVVFYFDAKREKEFIEFKKTGTITVEYTDDNNNAISKIWFGYWSIYDLRVPFYQGNRYYYRLGEKLCKKVTSPLSSGIEITKREKFTSNKIITKCSCAKLLEKK